jgi:hypothetical protein
MKISIIWPEGRARTALVGVALGLLALLDLLLMMAMRVEGGADIDTINFGLSALRFDLLQHQPHPPGYPGYVLWLKLIHALVPSLGPIEIAEWGSRLCAVLCIPAAFWACRRSMDDSQGVLRPLLAATLVVLHPMLVKYGSDGQSHAADALCTLLLFGATQAVIHQSTLARRLLLVAGFALAGAVRPNIPLLLSPLLIWAWWRRPLKELGLAVLAGLVMLSVWIIPFLAWSGGYGIYRRATDALLTDYFGGRFSVFGSRATWYSVAANMFVAEVSSLVAALPFIAWSRGQATWRRVLAITVVVNVGFYTMFYCAETGYLVAIAALACLAPASWPSTPGRTLRVRIALAFALGPLFLILGPARAVLPDIKSVYLPTLAAAAEWETFQVTFRGLVCQASAGRPSLVLSDFKDINHHRGVSLQCPNVIFASSIRLKSNPKIDNLVLTQARGMLGLPTGIPLESGPPVTYALPQPVERVLIAPDSSLSFIDEIGQQASCERLREAEISYNGSRVFVWPAHCLSRIKIGKNVLHLTPTPSP